jgi:uncharacterized protein
VIVLDTTVLVYAKGQKHVLRQPCRSLIEAIAAGSVEATTTPEVIQEFVHVRARRRSRRDAADLGRSFVELLAPLLTISENDLGSGLHLFEQLPSLGSFDAVLAAATIGSGADALISSDATFARVPELTHVIPGTPEFDRLLQH